MSDTDRPSLIRRTPWPESASRPVGTPLQPSVVYASRNPDALDAQYEGRTEGFAYSREGHPNAQILATKIDGMEGAVGGIVTSSGMAAVTAAVLGLLNAGDHIIAGDQLYGRSLRLMQEDLPRLGIGATLADPTDIEAFRKALHPETRAILVEVVSNPTLRVADMEGLAQLAREYDLLLMVDNTFTTPRAYRPFDHGADVVIHSVTKLLAGHSDAMLGYVVAKNPALQEQITTTVITWGMVGSPFDCWLAERGLYSFDLRFDRASQNAAELADHLGGLPGVRRVLYPLRADHPDHNRAAHLLGGQGGNMVSFEVEGGRAAANALTEAAANIAFAPTLGDIGTTLSHAASSSHRGLDAAAREAIGISEGFFRVSVGVEDIALLKREFAEAVAAAVKPRGV
ncbi:trans-sulfuration enzyme family protein [Aliiroseovarius sp. YM-037]|uniref:trans-sulfuration enzyme family protein n=1 Tax=Aliiroseovarius sp. YM-037 TaxID=3341728 RepID=UPI003A8093F8